MAVVFKNNANTTLSAAINSSATSIAVVDGSLLPSLSAGETFLCTIDDDTNLEIVKVTARSGNTLTVVRAQEGTTAAAFGSTVSIEARLTAGVMNLFPQLDGGTLTADTDTIEEGSTNLYFTNARAQAVSINNVVEDTTPQLGGDLASNGNDILFADSDKAIFGAGSDLQIYHTGANSVISDAGTGSLLITANQVAIKNAGNTENVAVFNEDSDVRLFYDNSIKLATTATGIDVTGTATMDGLDVSGDALFSGNVTLNGDASETIKIVDSTGTNGYQIKANVSSIADFGLIFEDLTGKDLLKIQSNNDISFYEDTGTTAKLFWDASEERLGLTGSDYQFYIQQGSNQPWYHRAVSDGSYRIHLNGTGDILSTTSTGINVTGAVVATSFSDGTISGITFIDEDSFATNSATRVPTQQSIKAYVDTQVAGVVDSAPAALDTLNELAAALGDDANFSTTTSTALGNRLRVDTAAQGLTGTQQANAITNLGITATKAELNYVDGVTSNIQTQLDGKQASGSYLTGNQTITLSGDVSGSGTTSIAVTIADDSHNHVISNVDGLQTALDAKLASSSYTASDVLTKIKTVDGAGSGLDADLLDGLSSASFATSAQGTLAANALPKSGGAMTGAITTNSTFDGRDVATDGAKLDGIAAGATNTVTNATHTGEVTGSGALTIANDVVDAGNLKVTGNGTTSQFLRSDGDGTFTWATPTDTNTTYSVGAGGLTEQNFTTTLKNKLDGIAASANNYSFPYTVSASAGNSTVVQRHASGYIYANYFNTSPNDIASGSITKILAESGDDGFMRHATAAVTRTFLNVENGATADQTAAEILTAIKTVDGAGSGLDADNLDGLTWASSGKNVRGTEVYADNWFRNYNSNEGIYNEATGQHFYSDDDDYWNIAGGSTANGLRFRDEHAGTVRGYVYANNSSQIGFLNSSGAWSLKCDNSGNVTATGNVTAYSDERLKDNILVIDNALEKVSQLRGVTFNRTDTEEPRRQTGVIAQEVEKVLPEAVITAEDEMQTKSVAYGNMVGLLIEAIKELKTEVDDLKKQLDESK